MKERIRTVLLQYALPVFIGILVFLSIYGTVPLDPCNDAWILAGYDETDIIQHYSGWIAFRNSDWAFPLGLATDMSCHDGTMISYTDSIPWVAIFFKAIRTALPATFQYFGWYTLLCYILQSVTAFHIVFLKTKNYSLSTLSAVLFAFSPILMERALRHTALASHWLILFSVLIWLKHRRNRKWQDYLWFLLLLVLAIGIHPYFLPMILAFLLICALEDLTHWKFAGVLFCAFDLAVTYLTGCLLGALGTGIRAARSGWGYYSMNLNALYNPTSLGGYTWSSFLPVRPQILGNYDGFNYLGLGILVGLTAAVLMNAFCRRKELPAFLKRNWIAMGMLLLCFAFAITNNVSFDDRVVLEYPLPWLVEYFCGIFRASGRMFYPVYYCLFLWVIFSLSEAVSNKRIGAILLASLLVLQLVDLHQVFGEKRAQLSETAQYASLDTDPVLDEILNDSSYILLDHLSTYPERRELAVAALKRQNKLYYSTAIGGNFTVTRQESDALLAAFRESGIAEGYVVATMDGETAEQYLCTDKVRALERNGIFFLYSSEPQDSPDLNSVVDDQR